MLCWVLNVLQVTLMKMKVKVTATAKATTAEVEMMVTKPRITSRGVAGGLPATKLL